MIRFVWVHTRHWHPSLEGSMEVLKKWTRWGKAEWLHSFQSLFSPKDCQWRAMAVIKGHVVPNVSWWTYGSTNAQHVSSQESACKPSQDDSVRQTPPPQPPMETAEKLSPNHYLTRAIWLSIFLSSKPATKIIPAEIKHLPSFSEWLRRVYMSSQN